MVETATKSDPASDLNQDDRDPPIADTNSTPDHAPNKVLPTVRVKISGQLEILRAYAAASGSEKKTVLNPDVAKIAGINAGTVSACNKFLSDIGLLKDSGRGNVPDDCVFEFNRANEWNPETAAHKLTAVTDKAWFWEVLRNRLSFRPLPMNDAIEVLADASAAGPAYRAQLEMLIELLVTVGRVKAQDGMVILCSQSRAPLAKEDEKEKAKDRVQNDPPPARTVENAMSLSVSISVPLNDVSRWEPQKVTDFMSEWAKLLNAKAAIEKMINDPS